MVFRVKLLDDIRRALGANAVPIKLLRELAVVPYFDNKPVFGTLPFDDSFLGPCLSALTKKARFDIVWKSALTSETVTLYTSKEAEPQQKVPQVIAANVVTDLISNSAANARKNAPPRPITLQLKVRNIAIDYSDSPIDVADPLTCRGIFPSLDNIEPMGLPRIQYDDTESRLRVVSEDGTVDTDWAFSSATVKILDPDPDTRYIQGEGSYTIKLEIRGLPSKPQTERRFLKGTIAITAGSKLTNTLANKIVSGANGVVVTINQEY